MKTETRMPLETERTLIRLAQAGDREALGELLDQFEPLIKAAPRHLPAHQRDSLADDARSEAALAVIEHIKSRDADDDKPLALTLPHVVRHAASRQAGVHAVAPSRTADEALTALRRAGGDLSRLESHGARGSSVETLRDVLALAETTTHDMTLGDVDHLQPLGGGRFSTTDDVLSEMQVQWMLSALTDDQRDIITRSLGLEDDTPRSLKTLATEDGVTIRAIRTRLADATAAVRATMEAA